MVRWARDYVMLEVTYCEAMFRMDSPVEVIMIVKTNVIVQMTLRDNLCAELANMMD